MKSLSEKQKAFVQEYLVDLNATQAATRAGYSPKTANEQSVQLMKLPTIKRAIMEAIKERSDRVQLDADWVLARLKLISDRCCQEIPVLDSNGKPTGEFKFDSAGANRATELIGKHLAMFTDKLEHTGADGGPIQIVSAIPRPDTED
jgi:phage terminase small subunit